MPDFLLMLGGVKAATDFSFLGDTWNEEEFEIFKSVFESQGLKLSKIDSRPMASGDAFRIGLIFDPVMLEKETANSRFAPPYKLGMDVHEYASAAEKNGYDEGGIWGKIYSFPESAIGNFVDGDKTGLRERVPTHNGETYWFFDPPEQDVIEREDKKNKLFDSLNKSAKFQQIVNSVELRESDAEWGKRLPNWRRSNR